MSRAMNQIISASLPYNHTKVLEKINKLDVKQNGLTVTTTYDDKLLKETEVSNKYYTFNFPAFVGNILPEVENYFTPSNYLLRMVGGRQELRLIGEELKINGDTFYRMLSILNSTDKSRALQMNMGLLRLVCTNGAMVSVNGEVVQVKGKHYKASLPDKIENFSEGLQRFKTITNQQREVLSDLLGSKVSYRELANALVRNKDNDVVESKVKKLSRFAGKLLTSDTDRLYKVTEEQRNILLKPELVLHSKDSGDIEIDKYTAYNCWTEMFRSNDTGKIKRECDRIISLLNTATT